MAGLKKALRLFNRGVTAILALLLGINLYIIGARLVGNNPQPAVFGWSWAVIISGSMEPEISVNDLVVVHKQKDYAVGDIITYKSESGHSVITHRIVDITPEGYITKGDANNAADFSPVEKSDVIGRVVKAVPNVGIFIDYLRTPLGMTCIVLLGLLLIEIPYLLAKGRKSKGDCC